MSTIEGLMMGVGLAAATGFRVFVPLLILALYAKFGGDGVALAENFQWVGTWPAILTFGTATVLELGAYYIPWFDNLMDSIATPAALVAGIFATASLMGDADPLFQWGTAIIAGGAAAGTVQLGTVLTRGASTATTGGAGNPVVSTGEAVGSVATASLAIYIPIIAFVVVLFLLYWAGKKVFFRRKAEIPPPAAT